MKVSANKFVIALVSLLATGSTGHANPRIFRWVSSRTTLIVAPRDQRNVSLGSGVLVDHDHGWVLTARHIVDGCEWVNVAFPRGDADGNLICDPSYYLQNLEAVTIPARVIVTDANCDLALVELQFPPATWVSAIPIALQSPQPGDTLHLVGNSGARESFWRYGNGTVRSVFHRDWTASDGSRFKCRVIENQIPSNFGDSGGPVVNDDGMLVGIVHGGNSGQNAVFYAIDVVEIQNLLVSAPPRRGEKPRHFTTR